MPYAVGDAFRGFPVVGTTEAFFDPRFPYPRAASSGAKLAEGRALRRDGVVHVEVRIVDGAPVEVTIAGDACILFSASLADR